MPTRARAAYAQHALESFLSQTYIYRELVILDDADDPSFPDGVTHELVRYERTSERLNIPAKRNRVNRMARFELIAHFDSDDWSAPERLEEQVAELEASGKAVTGYTDILFYNETNGTTCSYPGFPNWVSGTSLLYRKSFWMTHPFYENSRTGLGTDTIFARDAARAKQIHGVPGRNRIVARIHPGNSSPKSANYGPAKSEIPPEFFASCRLLEA